MAQHLNLYDPSLRPPRVWLTPWRVAAALLLLLLLMAGAAHWIRRDAARWQAHADQQQAALRALLALPAAAPGSFDDLPQLREQLARAQMLALAQGSAQDRALPANVLRALAQAAPGDVWLTAAQWQMAPRQLALEGALLNPNSLPNYLRRLEQQSVFQGQTFAQLQLSPQQPERPLQQTFVLRSQPKEGNR
jgi:Tfp pilus assembly protein PilN